MTVILELWPTLKNKLFWLKVIVPLLPPLPVTVTLKTPQLPKEEQTVIVAEPRFKALRLKLLLLITVA